MWLLLPCYAELGKKCLSFSVKGDILLLRDTCDSHIELSHLPHLLVFQCILHKLDLIYRIKIVVRIGRYSSLVC